MHNRHITFPARTCCLVVGSFAITTAMAMTVVTVTPGCGPEPRQTAPTAASQPGGGTVRSEPHSSGGLTPAQMATLRRFIGLRREAMQLAHQRKFALALKRLARAQRLAPTVFGDRHPFPAQVAQQRAAVYEAAGKWAAAAQTYDEVIRLWRRALDVKEHEPIAEALRLKGEALIRADRYAAAVTVLTRALAMWKRVATLQSGRYGPYYVYIKHGRPILGLATCNMDLGEAHMLGGALGPAKTYLKRAGALTHGMKMPADFRLQLNLDLAYLHQVSGRDAQAIAHLETCTSILEKAGPAVRRLLLRNLLHLASLHLRRQEYGRAQQSVARVQKLLAATPGKHESKALLADITLAQAFIGLGRGQDAKALLERLQPKVEKPGAPHATAARYFGAWTRLWLAKKQTKPARHAADKTLTHLHHVRPIRPMHGSLYALTARAYTGRQRLMRQLVAYWAVRQLGARNEPSAKHLAQPICTTRKQLGPVGTRAALSDARAEAKRVNVRPAGLPSCP